LAGAGPESSCPRDSFLGTKLPKDPKQRIEPLSVDAVEALTDAMPGRYRALVTLAAGTGLRQGEALWTRR
jgi:integrase